MLFAVKTLLFLFGGWTYVLLELLFRGRSHYSMFLAGGTCLLLVGHLNRVKPKLPPFFRALAGAGIITMVELLTGLPMEISKEDALDYSFSAMNHAMVITGVNIDENGMPNRWKIENSWGDKNGRKGYYICSDSWFDQYVYQAAVEAEYLGAQAELAKQEPVVLEPWDPMGTLAD